MIPFIFQLIQLFGFTNAAANTIFAHMVNHPDVVRWAIDQGANGIEMDLRFDGSKPSEFRHSGICDCSCICANGDNCPETSVCNKLWKVTGSHCNAKSTADEMTKALGSSDLHDKLAVIYIDSKIDENTPLRESGENIVKLLNENVFEKGYKGQVIISGSEVKFADYLKGALSAAKASKFADQYFYTYDAEGGNHERVFTALKELDTKNIAYATGITICLPGTYETAIKGSISKNAYAGIGIWTIDKESSMKDYVNFGVTSIMTNRIDNALKVIPAENLAKPGSALKL
ncbi:hypothetical protein BC833DRAFT_662313 [Globomyces pollinis-pini]|nr:hypothetical protein BC833DRAFT_662313 [Globomyces pollinis-pini]